MLNQFLRSEPSETPITELTETVDVEFKQRSTGIIFGIGENQYVIEMVVILSAAYKLGLKAGDTLVAVNHSLMTDLKHNTFYIQPLPFVATFSKSAINYTTEKETECETAPRETIPNDVANQTAVRSDAANMFSQSDHAQQLKTIEEYVLQTPGINEEVYFDKVSVTKSSQFKDKICCLSTKGFHEGYHEWSIQILKCDIEMQEIGVIATSAIDYVRLDRKGITSTRLFGARAIYGNELGTGTLFYGSYNNNSSIRCYKDLSKKFQIGWCTGDVITICLDLDRCKIKFFINGVKVRKVMSVQPGNTYYPVLSFEGNCKYIVH